MEQGNEQSVVLAPTLQAIRSLIDRGVEQGILTAKDADAAGNDIANVAIAYCKTRSIQDPQSAVRATDFVMLVGARGVSCSFSAPEAAMHFFKRPRFVELFRYGYEPIRSIKVTLGKICAQLEASVRQPEELGIDPAFLSLIDMDEVDWVSDPKRFADLQKGCDTWEARQRFMRCIGFSFDERKGSAHFQEFAARVDLNVKSDALEYWVAHLLVGLSIDRPGPAFTLNLLADFVKEYLGSDPAPLVSLGERFSELLRAQGFDADANAALVRELFARGITVLREAVQRAELTDASLPQNIRLALSFLEDVSLLLDPETEHVLRELRLQDAVSRCVVPGTTDLDPVGLVLAHLPVAVILQIADRISVPLFGIARGRKALRTLLEDFLIEASPELSEFLSRLKIPPTSDRDLFFQSLLHAWAMITDIENTMHTAMIERRSPEAVWQESHEPIRRYLLQMLLGREEPYVPLDVQELIRIALLLRTRSDMDALRAASRIAPEVFVDYWQTQGGAASESWMPLYAFLALAPEPRIISDAASDCVMRSELFRWFYSFVWPELAPKMLLEYALQEREQVGPRDVQLIQTMFAGWKLGDEPPAQLAAWMPEKAWHALGAEVQTLVAKAFCAFTLLDAQKREALRGPALVSAPDAASVVEAPAKKTSVKTKPKPKRAAVPAKKTSRAKQTPNAKRRMSAKRASTR